MKNISRLMLCLFGISGVCMANEASAQSMNPYVFGSGGMVSTLPSGNAITFTIGEAVVSTVGSNPVFSQGFNQPRVTSNPLPIKFTFSGNVENGSNRLNWTTYQEVDNDFFDLESSADGTTFAAIARIKTKAMNGMSSTNTDYTYLDRSFKTRQTFYRLKQVDRSGAFSYSNVVMLENAVSAIAALSFFPNPAKSYIQVNVPESGELSIIDLNGKIVTTMHADVSKRIDLTGYMAGAYYIKFQGKSKTMSVSFVKE